MNNVSSISRFEYFWSKGQISLSWSVSVNCTDSDTCWWFKHTAGKDTRLIIKIHRLPLESKGAIQTFYSSFYFLGMYTLNSLAPNGFNEFDIRPFSVVSSHSFLSRFCHLSSSGFSIIFQCVFSIIFQCGYAVSCHINRQLCSCISSA